VYIKLSFILTIEKIKSFGDRKLEVFDYPGILLVIGLTSFSFALLILISVFYAISSCVNKDGSSIPSGIMKCKSCNNWASWVDTDGASCPDCLADFALSNGTYDQYHQEYPNKTRLENRIKEY
jgi:hypothetical protein